jgi:hypothetical protein
MKRLLPYIAAVIGAGIAGAIAYSYAGADINQAGDWRNGAARFVGMIATLGGAVGFFGVRQLLGKAPLARDGFTLSYRRIDPSADGYRETKTVSVGDLIGALKTLGYEPAVEACDVYGEPRGTIDLQAPLAGSNLALRDPRVRGWIRIELAAPITGQARSLGVIEVWSGRGDSAAELGLFVVRALDGLVEGLSAARESSRLSEDPASLLTAGLPDRPAHRR